MNTPADPRPSTGDVDYEVYGQGYSQQRRADPRIAAYVFAAIGKARTVLNVGAGAGSYEPDDRYVLAVEPSAAMRAQRPPGLTPAIKGVAEDLPVDDSSFDASMAMITIHQWSDRMKGLDELRRVTRGPIVVLTFDGDALERFWLANYVPELIAAERHRFPSIHMIKASLGQRGRHVDVQDIPIPIDCVEVRRGQSAWSFVDSEVHERFVSQLSEDLRSHVWDGRYGALRRQRTFQGSLRLVVSIPDAGSR